MSDKPAGNIEAAEAGPGNVSYFRHHAGLPERLRPRLDRYVEEREGTRKQSVKELERRRLAGTVLDPRAGRRWALQRCAAKLMREVETRTRAWKTYHTYRYRVTLCNAGVSDWRGSGDEPGGIRVYRSPDALRAEFRGVMTCGSTWHCPCCSPKIAKRRVVEVNHALKLWQQGFQGVTDQAAVSAAPGLSDNLILFATFTYQHSREHAGAGELAAQLASFSGALSELKRDGPYRRIMAGVDFRGGIRGLEPTYGELNGWHVHAHEILFVRGDYMATLRALRRVRSVWARKLIALDMAGLGPMDAPFERRKKLRSLLTRCYVIQHGGFACDYLASFGKEPEGYRGRWGLGSELARSHLKEGRPARNGVNAEGALPARCKHAAPWELLNDALDGDERSAVLFREYGEAFHGRRQLYWSKGLKDFFGVDEREDSAVAAQEDRRCTQFVGSITRDQWRAVLIADTRFTVLAIAARDGREFLQEYLERLERRYVSSAGPPLRAAV